MKSIRYIVLLLVVLINSGLLAQTQPPQVQKLERDLNRLHEKVIQAKRFSSLFSDPKIMQMVQAAEREYQQARQAFLQKKYYRAHNHVKLGFTILGRLYRLIRNNPFFRNKFKEQLDRKIQEAEQVVARQTNSEAQELLNRARYFRQRAFQAAQANQPDLAMKNYFLAIFFADNAIRTATGIYPQQNKNLDRYFENTNAMLMHARDLVSRSSQSQAHTLLDKAEREYRKAYRLYDDNRPRQAFVQLQIVNRLIYRILDLLEKTPESQRERLAEDIRLLESNLVSLDSRVKGVNSPDVQRLYQRITFLLTEARDKYQAGNYPAARQRLGIARRLFLQLHRRLNRNNLTPEEEIRNQLHTAQTMYTALAQNQADVPFYSQLLNLLQNNLKKAQEAFDRKEYQKALSYLRIFNHLAIKLEQYRGGLDTEQKNKEKAAQILARLKDLLNQNSSWQDDDLLKIRYQNASNLYQLASQACSEGQYRLCWQLSRTAIAILTK